MCEIGVLLYAKRRVQRDSLNFPVASEILTGKPDHFFWLCHFDEMLQAFGIYMFPWFYLHRDYVSFFLYQEVYFSRRGFRGPVIQMVSACCESLGHIIFVKRPFIEL